MIRLCAPLLLLSLGSPMLAAQNAEAAPREDAVLKGQLVAQVDAFMHAWQKQDAAALTLTMAPDFLYVSSQGVASRQEIVGALTHVCTLTSYTISDVRLLRISADSATLIYKIHQSASCAGHADPPVVLNTDTIVRRDGKWLFLVTTSTPGL